MFNSTVTPLKIALVFRAFQFEKDTVQHTKHTVI